MPRLLPRRFGTTFALTIMLAALALPAAAGDTLRTEAERSGFTITGRYSEVERLCPAFQQAHPGTVRCFSFGTTPEGRPMLAMAVSTSGALTSEAARQRGLPVVLAQGGIHAGEIDGKDAVFWMLRQWLEGDAPEGVLDRQVLLFVPVFNVDGHENFRAWHRPNQRGPEEMGFRVTARRYNLNRDYMKADSVEMRAMLRLMGAWDPLLLLDLHATNGAQFRHDISITGEPMHSGDAELQVVGRAVRDGIIHGLSADGHMPIDFYPSFVERDNPASGFAEGVMLPRFSTSYMKLRNRIGILVETHSWRTYPERVLSTRRTVEHAMRLVATHGAQWLATAHAADARARTAGGRQQTMTWKVLDEPVDFDFLGYAYTQQPSPISGSSVIRYDASVPQVWTVPLRNKVSPDLVLRAPGAGYVVPAAWAPVVQPLLDVHGIEYRAMTAPAHARAVREWTADTFAFEAHSTEGRQRLNATGQWRQAVRDFAQGDLFVPIAQDLSWLVMQLLEPQAPDALLAWGFMNNVFERKEYMEAYVTEIEAQRMLAEDPALKAEFEARLRDDARFAESPRERLDFFYRRHPAWDEGFTRYPVLQVEQVPAD